MIAPVAMAFMMLTGARLSFTSGQDESADPFLDINGIENFYPR
jgi:hypothetical protein